MTTARLRLTAALPLLGALAATAASPALGAVREFTLTAAASTWEISPGQKVVAWTYNQTLPGPELRVSAGDVVRVTLVNQLPEATTILPVGSLAGVDGKCFKLHRFPFGVRLRLE